MHAFNRDAAPVALAASARLFAAQPLAWFDSLLTLRVLLLLAFVVCAALVYALVYAPLVSALAAEVRLVCSILLMFPEREIEQRQAPSMRGDRTLHRQLAAIMHFVQTEGLPQH